jgi:hypothetical protein
MEAKQLLELIKCKVTLTNSRNFSIDQAGYFACGFLFSAIHLAIAYLK